MAFRRRRRFGGRRSRLPLRWTGDLSASVVTQAGAGLGYLTVVLPADYEQSATMEQGGATLLRIRGEWSMRCTVAAAGCVAVFAADEAVFPVAGGNYDPLLFSQLIRGDLLFREAYILPVGGYKTIVFDVKARRRLQDTQIHCVLSNTIGTVEYNVTGRALIRGG